MVRQLVGLVRLIRVRVVRIVGGIRPRDAIGSRVPLACRNQLSPIPVVGFARRVDPLLWVERDGDWFCVGIGSVRSVDIGYRQNGASDTPPADSRPGVDSPSTDFVLPISTLNSPGSFCRYSQRNSGPVSASNWWYSGLGS
jgi:hypothetical protein